MYAAPHYSTVVVHGITSVTGRYCIGGQDVHPGVNLFACRLRMLSTTSVRVTAPVLPQMGEMVALQLPKFAPLQGPVTRLVDDGFEMSLLMSDIERERHAEQVTLFSDLLWTKSDERRKAERRLPTNPRTIIARPDDWPQPCLVMDFSTHGAAVSAPFQPALGEVVTIGQVDGVVVRLFDLGFAVEFGEAQNERRIEALLEAPEEWRNAMQRAFPGL